jgi:hypothetical protein
MSGGDQFWFKRSTKKKSSVTKENDNNNKIKFRNNEKGTCALIDLISENRNVIKKEGEKIIKYKDLITRNSAHVECESNSVTSKSRGHWNHFKITQTIPEQHNRKTRN